MVGLRQQRSILLRTFDRLDSLPPARAGPFPSVGSRTVAAEWCGHTLPLPLYDPSVAIICRVGSDPGGRVEYCGCLRVLWKERRDLTKACSGLAPQRLSHAG